MSVDEFLSSIRKKCDGKHYIFRGTPYRYSEEVSIDKLSGEERKDGINSSLYRDAKDDVPFYEWYRPFNMEDEILGRAKKHSAFGTSNIEILTDLQHFHSKTNLIDFSRNLYIALFFACDGEYQKDGELLLLDYTKIGKERQDVVYADLQSSSYPFPIEPANTRFSEKRVHFQSSIFVYPPYGYINKDLCEIVSEPVPAYLKQPILDYLREMHDIHTDTIYNDLIGFIANEKNYKTAAHLFYEGFALSNKGDYEGAIGKYTEAIGLNPNFSNIYNNRGLVKHKLGQYSDAVSDYDKAIKLDKNCAQFYHNRGVSEFHLAGNDKDNHVRVSTLESVIVDFSRAIELDRNCVKSYYCRGHARLYLGQYSETIADCDEIIGLDKNDKDAYILRGVAKRKLGLDKEADKDFKMATRLKYGDA